LFSQAHSARNIFVDKVTGIPVLPQQLDLGHGAEEHHAPDMSDMRETVLNGDATSLHLDYLAPHDAKKSNHAASHPTTAPTTQPMPLERCTSRKCRMQRWSRSRCNIRIR